ncbi:signal peptidase II [Alsobacter sp. R-9]
MVQVRVAGAAVFLSAAVLAGDQWSKGLILDRFEADPSPVPVTPFLNLTLSFNPGVSFGMFQDMLAAHPGVVALVTACLSLGLLVWATLARTSVERVGLALMAGGAFGNAVDRWRRGAVTDFIDLHAGGLHWPTFNGADIAIVGGCAMIFADAVFRARQPMVATSARGHS